MQITAKLLRSWDACWSDDDIATHLGTRKSFTPAEVAGDETIALADRLWVLCRCLGHLDETAARLYAIESAELVARLAGDEQEQEQYLGIMNELRQIQLEMPAENRADAWNATWDAAWDAAWEAAWNATLDAARDAASAASSAAASAASRAASRAAEDVAWYAAWYAEIRKAIDRALEWLGEEAHS